MLELEVTFQTYDTDFYQRSTIGTNRRSSLSSRTFATGELLSEQALSVLLQTAVVNRESVETNLLQFSSLLFPNLGSWNALRFGRSQLPLKRGLLHFSSQDQKDLFSSVNTRVGKAIHTERVRFSQYIQVHTSFFFSNNNLCENIPISLSVP